MGGTYEEGHMLTFKIILLVSLGSAGDKQNKNTAGRSLFQHQEKISTLSPFARCLVSNNSIFLCFLPENGHWEVLYTGPHKKHWEEIFPKLENLSENIARIANAVQVTI